MQERRENEQYFFDRPTILVLADMLATFERPCVVCAPLVGIELEQRGKDVTILDIDERFRTCRGYVHWDLNRPVSLDRQFGVIFCDPPFFNVSLRQLFLALRLVAGYNLSQPMAVSFLERRAKRIMATFAPFALQPTAIRLGYRAVTACGRNEIRLFSNFVVSGGEQ